MSLDLSGDWALIDDPITVTLYVKTGEGAYDSGTSVPYVFESSILKEDVEVSPALKEKDSTVFHLWAAKLSGTVPKLGDKITDPGSVSWICKRIQPMDRDGGGYQRYRCTCTKVIT